MDQEYKQLRHHAGDYENQIKNLLDDKTHSIGRSLLDEAKKLVSEIDAKRGPRQLENRVKTLLRLLHEAKGMGEQIMDQRHITMLHHGYEHMLMALRKL